MGDKIELILTNSILVLCRMLLLRSLRLLRWLEAAGKLRSFLLDLLDLDLQRPAGARRDFRVLANLDSLSRYLICADVDAVQFSIEYSP